MKNIYECINLMLLAKLNVNTGHHELGIAALEKVRACVELKRQKELELI